MRTYIEKRLPLNDQRTLQHVASMAAFGAFGWEAGFRSDNQEPMAFASRLLVFSEQVALDSGRIQLGYLLAGFPDPSPLRFQQPSCSGAPNIQPASSGPMGCSQPCLLKGSRLRGNPDRSASHGPPSAPAKGLDRPGSRPGIHRSRGGPAGPKAAPRPKNATQNA